MKANISMTLPINDGGCYGKDLFDGEVELELDETYWRNEFAKAAMQGDCACGEAGLKDSQRAEWAFKQADLMVEEMNKRNENK